MYPVVQHPQQDVEARQKLAALEKRFGKPTSSFSSWMTSDLPDMKVPAGTWQFPEPYVTK